MIDAPPETRARAVLELTRDFVAASEAPEVARLVRLVERAATRLPAYEVVNGIAYRYTGPTKDDPRIVACHDLLTAAKISPVAYWEEVARIDAGERSALGAAMSSMQAPSLPSKPARRTASMDYTTRRIDEILAMFPATVTRTDQARITDIVLEDMHA